MFAEQRKCRNDFDIKKCIKLIVGAIDRPIARTIELLLDNGSTIAHLELASLAVDPLKYNYDDRFHFRDDYLLAEFLSKNKFLNTDLNLEEVSFQKFLESERQCKLTNIRIASSFDSLNQQSSRDLQLLLTEWNRKITKILPCYSFLQFGENIAKHAKFGPGSTTVTHGDATSPYEKVQDLGITWSAYPFVSLLTEYPSWMKVHRGKPLFIMEPGSNLLFVQKNAKTHRAICVEPNLNTFFQGAIGQLIKNSLARVGYNIPQLQEKHRVLAQRASIDGRLATIDLKAASDTISYKLVEAVLPPNWFDIMESLRCGLTCYKDEYIKLEKFSSMGNSYTFELETLIFLSLCMVLCDRKGISYTPDTLSVYGDDIICPLQIVDDLQHWLPIVGFEMNMKKSFFSGLFRESCGGHFFAGVDVTPMYIREGSYHGTELIILQNRLRNLAHRRCAWYGCDSTLKPVYDYVDRQTTLCYNGNPPRGPFGLGDGHQHKNWDEVRPRSFTSDGYRRWMFTTIQQRTRKYEARNNRAFYSSILYNVCHTENSILDNSVIEFGIIRNKNMVPYRKRTSQKAVKVLSTEWYDFGPWY